MEGKEQVLMERLGFEFYSSSLGRVAMAREP